MFSDGKTIQTSPLSIKKSLCHARRCFVFSRQIASLLLSELLIKSGPTSLCPFPSRAGLSYLSSRRWTASQASRRLSSTYIRNRILRQHARLLVSCFKRLGFDLPLNPRNQSHTGREETSTVGVISQK